MSAREREASVGGWDKWVGGSGGNRSCVLEVKKCTRLAECSDNLICAGLVCWN